MPQFLRPSSNLTQTNFTNGFAEIDETTAVDTDFAYSAINTTAVLQVKLSNGSPPEAGTTSVRYRIARTNGATVDGAGSNSTVTVELRQGASTIATDTTRSTTGTWTTFTWTPDVSTVTDWTDLNLYITVVGGSGSPANRRGAGISWAELEAPNAIVIASGDGSSTSTSTADGSAVYFADEDGSSTSASTADGDLAGTFNSDGAISSPSSSTGEFTGLFVSTADATSPSTATASAIWYFNSDGSISSPSTATGEFTGLAITTGDGTSVSIAYGNGWDGIVRQPGDFINDIEPNGWQSNAATLNDAIDEETTPDDSDVIWSPSYVGAPTTTLFDIQAIEAGVEYACKIRARTSNSVAANIKLMFYFDTTFITETPAQLLTTSLATYEFLITPVSAINRVRIHVSEAV